MDWNDRRVSLGEKLLININLNQENNALKHESDKTSEGK